MHYYCPTCDKWMKRDGKDNFEGNHRTCGTKLLKEKPGGWKEKARERAKQELLELGNI